MVNLDTKDVIFKKKHQICAIFFFPHKYSIFSHAIKENVILNPYITKQKAKRVVLKKMQTTVPSKRSSTAGKQPLSANTAADQPILTNKGFRMLLVKFLLDLTS